MMHQSGEPAVPPQQSLERHSTRNELLTYAMCSVACNSRDATLPCCLLACAGHVANYVETDQIVTLGGTSSQSGTVASYVVVRGSIPLLWTQLPNLKYKPTTVIGPSEMSGPVRKGGREHCVCVCVCLSQPLRLGLRHFCSLPRFGCTEKSVSVLSLDTPLLLRADAPELPGTPCLEAGAPVLPAAAQAISQC